MDNRNSQCACGSGKKYKRCCLPVEQAAHLATVGLPGTGPRGMADVSRLSTAERMRQVRAWEIRVARAKAIAESRERGEWHDGSPAVEESVLSPVRVALP